MKTLNSIGIEVPPGFDGDRYETIHQVTLIFKDANFSTWTSFGTAWKGVAHRFRAAGEHSARFTASIARTKAPEPDERYQQDHDLFGFVLCAHSALECWHFAMYCCGNLLDPYNFPMDTAKDLRLYPKDVLAAFDKRYGAEPIVRVMTALQNDPAQTSLEELRNVLVHRGIPPRKFHVGGELDGMARMPGNPKDLAARWIYSLDIGEGTTASRMTWLIARMGELLSASADFWNARTRQGSGASGAPRRQGGTA